MLRNELFDVVLFFFKQKTAYEMRISDWSSDVCSSDLVDGAAHLRRPILVVPDDHRRAVAPQDLRPVVQVGLGDHVEGIALALGPDREMAVELRPAGRREILRDAVGIGPFLGRIATRLPRPAIDQIGRASGRERECQYVYLSGVHDTLLKKPKQKHQQIE